MNGTPSLCALNGTPQVCFYQEAYRRVYKQDVYIFMILCCCTHYNQYNINIIDLYIDKLYLNTVISVNLVIILNAPTERGTPLTQISQNIFNSEWLLYINTKHKCVLGIYREVRGHRLRLFWNLVEG